MIATLVWVLIALAFLVFGYYCYDQSISNYSMAAPIFRVMYIVCAIAAAIIVSLLLNGFLYM